MPSETSKKQKDIDKLRRILDNPNDPTLATDDPSLDSVRRRLTHTRPPTTRTRPTTPNMQPHVTIRQPHPATEPPPTWTLHETPPTIPSSEKELPLWIPIDTPTLTASTTLPPLTFSDQPLFDIEQPEPTATFETITDIEPQPTHETSAEKSTTSEFPHWELVTPPTTTSDEPPRVPLQEFTEVTTESSTSPVPEPKLPASVKQTWRQRRSEKKTARIQAREAKRREILNRAKTTPEPQPSEVRLKPVAPLPAQNGEGFRGIPSIDDQTAELLFRNGYYTLEQLRQTPIGALVKTKGIKRKQARQIKKEVDDFFAVSSKPPEPAPKTKRQPKKKSRKDEDADVTEWESYAASDELRTPPICTYEGYTLYRREVKSGRIKTTMHFFSRNPPDKGSPSALPEGYIIAVNKRTGVPYIKKQK